MIRPAKWLVLCGVMILSPAPASAQEAEPFTKDDLEFLEFLGEWETDTGLWVDPWNLLNMPSGDVEKTSNEKELPSEPETDPLPEQPGEHEW